MYHVLFGLKIEPFLMNLLFLFSTLTCSSAKSTLSLLKPISRRQRPGLHLSLPSLPALELKYLLFMGVWDPFQIDYPFVSGLHKSSHLQWKSIVFWLPGTNAKTLVWTLLPEDSRFVFLLSLYVCSYSYYSWKTSVWCFYLWISLDT